MLALFSRKNEVIFIKVPGTIVNLFFSSFFSTAYFATYSLLNDGAAKSTPATLLKFVLTGPGHNTEILTFELFFFNSVFTPCDNLYTYAFEA